jgi:hypothetical protein
MSKDQTNSDQTNCKIEPPPTKQTAKSPAQYKDPDETATTKPTGTSLGLRTEI